MTQSVAWRVTGSCCSCCSGCSSLLPLLALLNFSTKNPLTGSAPVRPGARCSTTR